MVSFIARRILVSVLILIAASFIMYNLAAIAGNPLQDLQGSNSPNRAALIAARVATQHLDVIPPLRWGIWIGGVGKCVIGQCDLGTTFHNQPVTQLLPQAMQSTLQLVTFSFVLAIIFGIGLGIVTALRAYSGFDYGVTLVSFFLYSLPSFLMAVLLKSFVALDYNNFLAKPHIAVTTLIVIAVVLGAIVQLVVGGDARRRAIVFGLTAVVTAGMLLLMEATGWFNDPSLGPVFVILFSAGLGLAMVTMLAGTRNNRAWLVGGINVLIAIICYFTLQGLLNVSSGGTIFILAVAAVVVGLASGYFVGGHDRGLMMRIGALTAFLTAGVIVLDRFMRSWHNYSINFVGGRPIATVGSGTPGLQADFWITGLDTYTHLLLPSISLLLISFASYTRYSRSGMLEVLEQDYVRTARAKGLPERTVIVRHALRNMLIPIATLVATDIGALLGGAIITETVFAISGMGALFNSGLSITDVNPVMGYFLVIAITAIVFNFLADLAYSVLDPRVRVR
ncbi:MULTISPECIES: ABC transporter permease [unclassified Curtobacterium]|uniref:ABC transporter permease n=1 Tax=unclassified Curtobacterium TaxID=257496 RepID=UPI000DA6E1B6|nr:MULTISPECIES: ABC transporter permease [unclassified Curtobacterium]PZE25353.1 ABC transporter permease [Curtobacterium sp. MCBD17_028]PZE75377.1 ABC transporter permease [Curtobacterium sp. MCBD17_019]PZF57991.1 ABC transporter permease [Curtobacterium sp. MCBD17_034]PZF61411.1 ABC transporter permease [Curtobacterium sp. MCBD17_013]PZM33357.1 ABC transporter permease [Curtobacterium sp. MCBD17_031]